MTELGLMMALFLTLMFTLIYELIIKKPQVKSLPIRRVKNDIDRKVEELVGSR